MSFTTYILKVSFILRNACSKTIVYILKEPALKGINLPTLRYNILIFADPVSIFFCQPIAPNVVFVLRYVVVQKLFHSNLILVVVDTLCSDDIWTEVRITEMEVKDSNLFCLKVVNNELTQKQPKTCVGKGAKREMVRLPYKW